MCREAFLSSLFLWFVTPYMTPVQHTELCPYWLHSFVLVQFCFADQILCSFAPISRWLQFCTKLFFCACNCTFLRVMRTEGSMQHSECIVNICLCTWEEAVQLHRTHVQLFIALQLQCEQTSTLFYHQCEHPAHNIVTFVCATALVNYLLKALGASIDFLTN